MTINELCDVFSAEISKAFVLSKDEIKDKLFNLICNVTPDMTEKEVYSAMILNSIILSANLSAQVVITGLVEMGIIPKDVLAKTKLKPDIHPVKFSKEVKAADDQEEVKIELNNILQFKTKDESK